MIPVLRQLANQTADTAETVVGTNLADDGVTALPYQQLLAQLARRWRGRPAVVGPGGIGRRCLRRRLFVGRRARGARRARRRAAGGAAVLRRSRVRAIGSGPARCWRPARRGSLRGGDGARAEALEARGGPDAAAPARAGGGDAGARVVRNGARSTTNRIGHHQPAALCSSRLTTREAQARQRPWEGRNCALPRSCITGVTEKL